MTKRLIANIKDLISTELNSRIKTGTNEPLPSGYNPLSVIRGGLFHWVAVPFNGVDVYCELRCLNATQLETCGNITNIMNDDGKVKTNFTREEMLEIRNYQENLAGGVLNKPTFDEIGTLIDKEDFVIKNKRAELAELKEQAKTLTGKQKDEVDNDISRLELFLGYVLPTDTMIFLTQWAMGNDISDIKKISREKFIEAASLAKIAGKDPTDYISGVFTDYNKKEINIYAWNVYSEYMELKKHEHTGKYKWFFGGRT
jgi:hypothetical protein